MKFIKPETAVWRTKEWLGIIKNLLCARVSQGQAIDELQHYLAQAYPESSVMLLNSARAGLALALGVFQQKVPTKCEVIIPEYICDSVPKVILSCGLTPIFVSVKKDLNLDVSKLEENLNNNTLAVILPHMYAKAADIAQAEAMLMAKGVFLIDDAAQVAGVEINNKPLGSFGDVGVLSFAQAKTIVTGVRGSGGVLFINNKKLLPLFNLQTLPKNTGRAFQLLHFLFAYKWQGWAKKLDYYLQRLHAKLFKDKPNDYYSEIKQISNLEADIALAQFSSLSSRIQQSKEIIAQYSQALRSCEGVLLVQVDRDDLYLTRLIIQSQVTPPKQLAEQLIKQGIKTKFVYGTGSKVYDGSYCSGLLELPLQGLKLSQIEKVVQAVVTH
ncbi:DegT/DnrJ/EryC1/StrS family aminotransferase [Litorilituus lipolyticus]|uniref:DegT/DnrJ/EryC1/StrS aminotransferase family protein n=1 Tax=Litorilituus lipolyticus TaxID=2491017 RepID=A0A502KSI1_9GAMM|nr:DegT/DnrJ/EryC1/StrS family aminotransferase [Litorilituus lipolyticus]TPH13299.1 hypothetical protein EPA86_13985 [Litorilituus lipolyticus]